MGLSHRRDTIAPAGLFWGEIQAMRRTAPSVYCSYTKSKSSRGKIKITKAVRHATYTARTI